jgi:hypothetical protein
MTHTHLYELCSSSRNVPEFTRDLPEEVWMVERDPGRIEQMLNERAKAVRDAVKSRVEADRRSHRHYDRLILLLQHMVWHERYHHGQVKLVLKVADCPMTNEEAGPVYGLAMTLSSARLVSLTCSSVVARSSS